MGHKTTYQTTAHNDAQKSENRIHSDDIARQFGFEGALVAGVVVFGHIAYLPMKAAGEGWLTDNLVEVKFLKPAYDGQLLDFDCESTDKGCVANCYNENKVLLTTLTSHKGLGELNPACRIPPATEPVVRKEIHWDNLYTDKPAPAHIWFADKDTNLKLTQQLTDDNPLYSEGEEPLVHPFWISRQCNSAFSRSFILPAWIHVGTKFYFRRPLRSGHEIEIRMVPLTKWERKGHQFVTLYIAFLVNDEVFVETEHTAIFKLADPEI